VTGMLETAFLIGVGGRQAPKKDKGPENSP